MGRVVGDVVITREEIEGIMAGLPCTNAPPTGSTRLTDWARRHAETLSLDYAGEIARRVLRSSGKEGVERVCNP